MRITVRVYIFSSTFKETVGDRIRTNQLNSGRRQTVSPNANEHQQTSASFK